MRTSFNSAPFYIQTSRYEFFQLGEFLPIICEGLSQFVARHGKSDLAIKGVFIILDRYLFRFEEIIYIILFLENRQVNNSHGILILTYATTNATEQYLSYHHMSICHPAFERDGFLKGKTLLLYVRKRMGLIAELRCPGILTESFRPHNGLISYPARYTDRCEMNPVIPIGGNQGWINDKSVL